MKTRYIESLFGTYKPRPVERIPEILALLEEAWRKYPDLRLGQLMVNIVGREERLFYLEDEILVDEIKTFLASLESKEGE